MERWVYNPNKVHHIIKDGLHSNRYYMVYVTQVNKDGVESPRSEPSMIRVGDVEPPPTPRLQVDCTIYENGCFSENEFVNVMLKWPDISQQCDDLDHYNWWEFTKFPEYKGEQAYSYSMLKRMAESGEIVVGRSGTLTSGTTSATLPGCVPGKMLYIALQAVDVSRNASDVFVIGGVPEDKQVVLAPAKGPEVSACGSWALKVKTQCPDTDSIRSIVFYRDGWMQLPPIVAHRGLWVEYIDKLTPLDGLTHFYTYKYITKDDRESIMSPESSQVTTTAIDDTEIDKGFIDILKKAWDSDIVETKEAILEAAKKNYMTAKQVDNAIKKATKNYEEVFKNYKIIAENYEILSGKVEKIEEGDTTFLRGLTTQIKQNAKDITLRATKTDVTNNGNAVKKAVTSLINVQAGRIDSLVTSTSGYSSSITSLENQIRAKVSKNDLKSEINLAIQNGISVATVIADRIVLKGEMLLQGNARLKGRLYSDGLALVDSRTNMVVWGGGSGFIKEWEAAGSLYENEYNGFGNAYQPNWTDFWEWEYTPRPESSFPGFCMLEAEVEIRVGVSAGWEVGTDAQMTKNAVKAIPTIMSKIELGFYTSADSQFYDSSNHRAVKLNGSRQLWNYFRPHTADSRERGRWWDPNHIATWHGPDDEVFYFQKSVILRCNALVHIGQPMYFKLAYRGPWTDIPGVGDSSYCTVWAGYMNYRVKLT